MAECFAKAEPKIDAEGREYLDSKGYGRYRKILAEIMEDQYITWFTYEGDREIILDM